MDSKNLFVFVFGVMAFCDCLPTMYKVKDNKVLERDLVSVSSTVIPLPIYRVSSSGYNVKATKEDEMNEKPKGPVSLLTVVNGKKRILEEEKKVEFGKTLKA
ncbi:hypothetical protein ABEB36_006384 [Hypothenemus hampei]|uniref:Uncharacterized protein n=1 Tax=Hypothenemus hampei TaxID=57062 RepID=A0ABD1EQD2_HYPHA